MFLGRGHVILKGMKETHQLNFDDTVLTRAIEALSYDLLQRRSEVDTFTTSELLEFIKLDRLISAMRDEVLAHAAAEALMHNSQFDIDINDEHYFNGDF